MPLTTRTALPADFDRVAEVTRASFLAGPYGHIHANPERERFELDVAARAAWGAVLVAVDGDGDGDGGEIVGATSLLRASTPQARLAIEGEAEIRLLAVDPAAQGSGIGEALVRASIAEAKAWGVRRVVLDTGSLNERAQRLYLRVGFQRTPAAFEGESITSYAYAYDLDDSAGTVIRLIRPSEHEAVGQLTVDAYSAHYDLPQSYLAELADVASRARDHEVWVLEDRSSGRIVATVATPRPGAFISSLGQQGELDFRLLAVAPDAAGHGYGAALTRHVLALAVERGLTRVVMNSGDMMLPAHALYEKLGFTRIPERDLVVGVDGREVVIYTFGYDL